LKNSKRIGRYHHINNYDNSISPSHFDQLVSLQKDIGWEKSSERIKLLNRGHSSLENTLARASRIIKKSNKFMNKIRSRETACINRAKLIPENATIRKEYVKCKKANCHHDKHGPYYYAYWQDPVAKKLNKKYIGSYMPENKQAQKYIVNNNN
jgi:hypothetical protein